jgi:DNA polymerase-3 subunit gamma/tau
MSYQALARRYRPRTFEEVVGQTHVVRALTNALDQGRLHHAWLFSGTRGVGKTTIARILARCLNCEQGVSAHPCGECDACRAILENRFVDLIEVDAASRTRVEETRELLEGVSYAPAVGRYKVYLIDEVHMLSTSSFNALLKTLEEPPEHVKFLFATTEPEKVLMTVRSRCLTFALHRLPAAEIETALAQIIEQEGLEAEPAALTALARAARGSVRDGLSLLDQALAFGGGQLAAGEVAAMLGNADREAIYDLLDRLAEGDGEKLLECLAYALRGAQEPDDVLNALAETLALVARRQLVANAPLPADVEPARLERLAEMLPSEAVQLDYDIAVAGKRDLASAPDPGLGLEMVLLRMLAFRPDDRAAPPPSQEKPERKKARALESAAKEGSRVAKAPSPSTASDDGDWEAIVERLELDGLTRQLAHQCSLVSHDANHLSLALDGKRKQMLTPRLEQSLQAAIAKEFGAECKLIVKQDGEKASNTPAAKRSALEAQRQARAEQTIADDPHVAALRKTFDAELIPNTIRPEN